MSLLTRTYTFTDGTTAYGSQVDSEIANIVNCLNSLDQAGTTWTNVKVTTLLPQTDINAGGHKITNLGTPTTSGDAISYPIAGASISNSTITIGKLSLSTGDLTQTQSSVSGTLSLTWTTATSKSITTTGGKVLLLGSLTMSGQAALAGTGYDWDIIVGIKKSTDTDPSAGWVSRLNISQVAENGTPTRVSTLPVMIVDAPVAGTYTYQLIYNVSAGTSTSVSYYSLQAIELKY